MFSSFPEATKARPRRGARWLEGLTVLIATLQHASPALAEVEPRLTVDGSVFLSSNPFLLTGTGRDTVIGQASLGPSVTVSSPTGSTLEMAGVISQRVYSRQRYDNVLIGRARAEGAYRDSERLSLFASAGFDRAILADQLTSGLDTATDGEGIREEFSARGGLVWRPDAYFELQPEVRYFDIHYPTSPLLHDTGDISANLAFRRRTNPYTTLGGRVEVTFNSGEAQSDFRTYSGFVTLERRLAEQWRLTAEIGAERHGAHDRRLPGQPAVRQEASTRVSGNMELCHERHRLTLCASARLESEAGGLGGLERRTAATLSATRRLSESVTMELRGDYQHAFVEDSGLPELDTMRADARLEWRMSRNIRLEGAVEYRRQELFSDQTVDAGFVGITLSYDWRRRA